MTRRKIKSVLHNFLGTYTSRYSDYDGYWVFGMLVHQMDRLEIDLFDSGDRVGVETPLSFSIQLAAERFADQLAKAHVPLTWVRSARLNVVKPPDIIQGQVNGRPCSGHNIRFTASVISDLGKTYERTFSVFVAPHSLAVERRRRLDHRIAGPTAADE